MKIIDSDKIVMVKIRKDNGEYEEIIQDDINPNNSSYVAIEFKTHREVDSFIEFLKECKKTFIYKMFEG